MKRFFLLLNVCICAMTLNAQSVMVCNFDDVFPDVSTGGGLSIDYTDAPAGSPASEQMGALWVPEGNPSDGYLVIQLDNTFDPRDYVGISFLAQAPVNPSFILKLEQSSSADAGATRIQDWTTWPKYTGDGEWQEVHIGFDIVLKALQEELDKDADFPAAGYDKIILVPGPYESLPEFTVNLDDIKLRTSWEDEETGIRPAQSLEAISIAAVNGTVSAKSGNGNPVSLKVYSLSGQEVANGVNQVQLGVKGVYIVKSVSGNASRVSKMMVQ